MRKGFTLSEVFITLGIIGVVAAITMPTVVANVQKEKTVSYVKKFYNEINNAVRMSAVDHGDVNLWMPERKYNSYKENLAFLNEYILPYIKYLKVEPCKSNRVCTYLSYGMFVFRVDAVGADIAFFVNSKYEINPRNRFSFQFNKNTTISKNSTFVEPYVYRWNGKYETLKTSSWGGCNPSATDDDAAKYAYCTKWIQLNDWKIPDDYPWNAK